MNRNYEIIDVCHTIHDGMITYKGLPPPVISDHLTRECSREHYAPGTEFHIGRIEMVANTGTYLDSPFHRYPEGTDLAGLSLYSLANLDGVVIRRDVAAPRAIEPSAFASLELKDKAVLFHTGWDLRWRTEAYSDGTHPFITADAAELLVAKGAALDDVFVINPTLILNFRYGVTEAEFPEVRATAGTAHQADRAIHHMRQHPLGHRVRPEHRRVERVHVAFEE